MVASTHGEESAAYRIEHQTILTGKKGLHFTQSRTAIIAGTPQQVILTTQETELTGAHGYRDMLHVFSEDLGRAWKTPVHIENLRRARQADGYDIVIGDVCPQWHAKTGVVLATGKTFNFRDGKTEDRARERVSYTVYDPKTQAWSGLNIVQLPEKDREGRPMLEANAGCHQRFDLENGEILLPIRYRKDPKTRQYTTIVARCGFDGKRSPTRNTVRNSPRGTPADAACTSPQWLVLTAATSSPCAQTSLPSWRAARMASITNPSSSGGMTTAKCSAATIPSSTG